MSSIRKKCLRLEIIKLFLDHTVQEDVDIRAREIVCGQNFRLLCSALKEPDFLSGSQTFKKLKKAIDICCRKVGESFLTSKGIQECIICLETIKTPVMLPCGHVGCQSCIEENLGARAAKVCPKNGCDEVVPEDFEVRSKKEIERAVKEHANFRKNLTQFFVEMLQKFVFASDTMPHEEIIHDLLSFIVTKELPKDESVPRTRQLSPFPGDFIDSKPVIRSFVLQLLLKFDVSKVEIHLQKFLDDEELIIQSDVQFSELCMMIVQCLEDSIRVGLDGSTGNAVRHVY